MNNIFPLDTIRAIIEQTLLEQHIKHPTDYFGGTNQVNLFSFYEQLQKEDEVDRYVEVYRDLTEQQNRTGLIMNGVIIAPENPTITNLYLDTIIPMSFTCSFRVKLGDRDKAITTINNLIETLKGRKQDVALFTSGKIFKVGTICNMFNSNSSQLTTQSGDFIGDYDNTKTYDNNVELVIKPKLTALGINFAESHYDYYYMKDSSTGKLIVIQKINKNNNWIWDKVVSGDANTQNIVFPPANETFEKYKVSMSFDSLRCDEPRTLNANEYCTISFGGSATLVNDGVALGNDLVKLGIAKNKIVASPNIVINQESELLTNATWLEPLEMPSGNNANTLVNQLMSNKFNTNSHTTNITIANQYSFVIDRSIPLIDQLYKYARYGFFGIDTSGETPNYNNAITPNMIFRVFEINSSWGDIEINSIDAKIVESIDIENTESDTLSMTLTFQKQGGSENGGSGGGGSGGDTAEYVTVDTTQTITGAKTFTNQLTLTNTLSNGTYVYTLPLESGRLATREWVSENASTEDTKNTAGATDNSSTKLFLVGAETQGANPQTYTNRLVYIGADNLLYVGIDGEVATKNWVSSNFSPDTGLLPTQFVDLTENDTLNNIWFYLGLSSSDANKSYSFIFTNLEINNVLQQGNFLMTLEYTNPDYNFTIIRLGYGSEDYYAGSQVSGTTSLGEIIGDTQEVYHYHLALQEWVGTRGYATQTWVENKGYVSATFNSSTGILTITGAVVS